MSLFDVKTSFNTRNFKSKKELGFEEILFDAQLDDPESIEPERESINYRLMVVILGLCFVALFGRIYYLQAMKGEDYRIIAEGNKLRNQHILAPRGLILDKTGKIITGNLPAFELVAIPNELPENEEDLHAKLRSISEITGATFEELQESVSKLDRKSPHPTTLLQNLAKDPALILIGKKDEFKGFSIQNNPIRDYKDPLVFAHITGYTGKVTAEELSERQNEDYLRNDYIGKTGLEFEYEKYLKGIPGSNQTEIDAQGDFNKNLPAIPAVPGKNLKLNIDYDLQKVVYDSMVQTMAKTGSKKGAVVATNPQTGQVLALLSLPGYDGNQFSRGIKNNEYAQLLNDPAIPLLNRSINGTYPPGSTIKPLLALGALTDGIVTPQTKILDDGVIRVGSYTFYGYRREGLGVMDVYSAIARSSDIYFYTIGGGSAKSSVSEGMGAEGLAKWYRNFNFGSTLGIDLPSEKSGLVPDPDWKKRVKNEPWYLGDTYHYAIGQGDMLATPLQVNNATATIAADGKIMQPYLVDEVVDEAGNVVHKNQPKTIRENFLNQEFLNVVQEGMRQTVTIGSGRSLATIPLEIAGKTGTAQFDARDLSLTHAWFTSYAPFENPQIALTILVESGGEGSSVAVPIAKEIYTWWEQNRHNK